jgi:hypothetical protein
MEDGQNYLTETFLTHVNTDNDIYVGSVQFIGFRYA